jgi:hypothetical protein
MTGVDVKHKETLSTVAPILYKYYMRVTKPTVGSRKSANEGRHQEYQTTCIIVQVCGEIGFNLDR